MKKSGGGYEISFNDVAVYLPEASRFQLFSAHAFNRAALPEYDELGTCIRAICIVQDPCAEEIIASQIDGPGFKADTQPQKQQRPKKIVLQKIMP